ncbi:MAG: hypothetical protein H7A46_16980 [Verrucomicrobiales bacterium]|nr:hypothetical protein [Verrucomicrobiales bacterium]
MSTFEQLFPEFVAACVSLFDSLVPWGMILLILGFAWKFSAGPPTAPDILRFIVKVFLLVMLIVHSHSLINEAQAIVAHWTEQNVPARPENVAKRYQEKLAEAQGAPQERDRSFLGSLFSSDWFEAIIYAVLTLISWLAMALMYFVYSVQRIVLLICWVLSPILFATMAIGPVSGIGLRHLLRMIGVILWPLGLALASTVTDGLIGAATDRSLLVSGVSLGWLGYGLQNLLAVTVIAVWICFASVLAPMLIQRIVVGSPGPTSIVTSVASLVTGAALPFIAGVASRIQLPSWRPSSFRFTPADSQGSTPLATTVIAPSPAPPGSPVEWQPNAADPTGDAQVRAVLDRLKSS